MDSQTSKYYWPHKSSTTIRLEGTLGIELLPWQQEVAETWNGDKLLVKAARRGGKSILGLFLGLREAWQWGRSANLICSNFETAKLAAQRLKAAVPACHITQQSELSFFFDSGGHLRIAPSLCPSCNSKLLILDDSIEQVDEEEVDQALGFRGRVAILSSWPAAPDTHPFGQLWRYGGLSWQRLEVPAPTGEWLTEAARLLTESQIYPHFLRTPEELRSTP